MQYENIDESTRRMVRGIIRKLGKNNVARIAQVTIRTVDRWFNGDSSPSVYAYNRLEAYKDSLS